METNLEQGSEFRKIASLNFLYEINSFGKIRNVKSKRVLKPYKNNQGYLMIAASIKGVVSQKLVHRLVAECWLEHPPFQCEIDHIDRVKTNNDFRNLRYVTHSENNKNRVMSWKHPIEISGPDGITKFETMKECAMFLSEKYGKTYKSIRVRLSTRRARIYDYDITYLTCAETVRSGSNEQETVQN